MSTGPEKGWDMRTLPVELAWKGGWGRHSHSFKPCQASGVGSILFTGHILQIYVGALVSRVGIWVQSCLRYGCFSGLE